MVDSKENVRIETMLWSKMPSRTVTGVAVESRLPHAK